MSARRTSTFQEFFFKRLENHTRCALRRINDAMHNPNLRRLLSFFTFGKILNIVLHIIDEYKVPTCYRNRSKTGNLIQFARGVFSD